MEVRFMLNGLPVKADVSADTPLLDMLRRLGIHSVRRGCDTSNCGICTVWVDDKPVLSCSFPAMRTQGRSVTTIEGVKSEADAEELIQAFSEEGADQCGFCSPGLLMSVLAMLREYDDPSEKEIKIYLAGNLCRCTGYASQLRAISRVLNRRKAHDDK